MFRALIVSDGCWGLAILFSEQLGKNMEHHRPENAKVGLPNPSFGLVDFGVQINLGEIPQFHLYILSARCVPSRLQIGCIHVGAIAMAPKRPSNGSSTSGRPAKKGKTDELMDLVEKEKGIISTMPFWDSLVNQINDMFATFGSVPEYLLQTYPSFEDRKSFSQLLMDSFPTGETLSSDGIKSFALWQICYHVEAGNKGLVINEFMRTLIMLMLAQGPRFDAVKQAGVEYVVIQPLVASYFDTPWDTELMQPDTYNSQSIGFTKGWTRSVAAVYAAHLIIKNDLVDEYKKEHAQIYENFCLLKGMVTGDYVSEIDRINANRGTLTANSSWLVSSNVLGIKWANLLLPDPWWVLPYLLLSNVLVVNQSIQWLSVTSPKTETQNK